MAASLSELPSTNFWIASLVVGTVFSVGSYFMMSKQMRRLKRLSAWHRRVNSSCAQTQTEDHELDDDIGEMNIPWTMYRPFSAVSGSLQQRVVLNNDGEETLYGLLTIPKKRCALHIVITCPGMYRCTEGPGCLYNELASVLPTGGLAVLQVNSRLRCQSISDAMLDLKHALRYVASDAALASVQNVIFIGWSMGGAAVIRLAGQMHQDQLKTKCSEHSSARISLKLLSKACFHAPQRHASKSLKVKGLVTLASVPWGVDCLANLSLPLLVAHSKDDATLPVESANAIARLSPVQDEVKVLILESGGHRLEDPCTLSEIADWIGQRFQIAEQDTRAILARAVELTKSDCYLHVGSDVDVVDIHAVETGAWIQSSKPPGWRYVGKTSGRITKLDYSAGPDRPLFEVSLRSGRKLQVVPSGLKRKFGD